MDEASEKSASKGSFLTAGCCPITGSLKKLLEGSKVRAPIAFEDIPFLERHLLRGEESVTAAPSQHVPFVQSRLISCISLPNLTHVNDPTSRNVTAVAGVTKDDDDVLPCGNKSRPLPNRPDTSSLRCNDINVTEVLDHNTQNSPSLMVNNFTHPFGIPSVPQLDRLPSLDYGDSGYSTPGVAYLPLPYYNRQRSNMSDTSDGIYEPLPEVVFRNKDNQRNTQNTNFPRDFPVDLLQRPTQTLVSERMFNDLCEDLASGEEWKKVGHYMFPNAVVQNIDVDHKSSRERAYQLLIRWQKENGEKATVERLAAIFKKADRTDLAERIEKISKNVWRHSLEVLEEQGLQPELVKQLQDHIRTLQNDLNQRHEESVKVEKELRKMYDYVQHRELTHKVTEIELTELQKTLYKYQKQDGAMLSPKWVESLLERMHGIEEALKTEKMKKQKQPRNGDDEVVQIQCMTGLVNNIKRRLPSSSSGKRKSYSPIKKEIEAASSRVMRQSYIFALDDPLPNEELPTSETQKTHSKQLNRPPPPYRARPQSGDQIHHSQTVPDHLMERGQLHRCTTAPSRLDKSLQEGGGNCKMNNIRPKELEWMKDLDEDRAVTV